MPTRIAKVCRDRCCGRATTNKSGYCDDHAKTKQGWTRWEHSKKSTTERGYGHEWEKIKQVIKRRDLGMCQECRRNGRAVPGREVDHITPKSQGGTDDHDNLELLCKACHKAKTDSEKRGGVSQISGAFAN